MKGRRRLRATAASIGAALLIVAGCNRAVTLPTHQFQGAGGLLFEVTLRGDNVCVWLEGGGIRYDAIWPAGFAARSQPVELIAPDGKVFARAGDTLGLGASERNDMSIGTCQVGRVVLIVGEVVSVNGAELHVPPTPETTPRQPSRPMG